MRSLTKAPCKLDLIYPESPDCLISHHVRINRELYLAKKEKMLRRVLQLSAKGNICLYVVYEIYHFVY